MGAQKYVGGPKGAPSAETESLSAVGLNPVVAEQTLSVVVP